MHIFEKEFDFVIKRAKSLKKPARVVIAGAELENILQAVFEAEDHGICTPVPADQCWYGPAVIEKRRSNYGAYLRKRV